MSHVLKTLSRHSHGVSKKHNLLFNKKNKSENQRTEMMASLAEHARILQIYIIAYAYVILNLFAIIFVLLRQQTAVVQTVTVYNRISQSSKRSIKWEITSIIKLVPEIDFLHFDEITLNLIWWTEVV